MTQDTVDVGAAAPSQLGQLRAGQPPRREHAQLDGDFVVFLIGMRINRPWRVASWLPVVMAMPQMIRELEAQPQLGLLNARLLGLSSIQYWRSQEQLLAYARSRGGLHLPAWQAFNRRARQSGGDVGIWHETYRVRAGEYENMYVDIPPLGLGKAGRRAAAGH